MIEWLVIAGIAAFFGNRKEEPRFSKPAPRFQPATAPQIASGYEAELASWRLLWEDQIDSSRWIPESTASRIVEQFPLPNRPGEVPPGYWKGKRIADLKAEFAAHNLAFLAQQKERQRVFFETVEKNPLTEEQIEGCICMDDALLIVAAAGSGKTSTMVAKAGYVLNEDLAKPDQVLMLAFNRAAANELGHRVRARLEGIPSSNKIKARTFSAFGLEVIGEATGTKPSLAPWIENPGDDVRKINEIVQNLCIRDPAFKTDWDFFRAVYGRAFSSSGSASSAGAQPRYITADGKKVKSQQECAICNFLFFNGVAYLYEPEYEHKTADAQYRQYRPDFYYPEVRLYHEHFALDADGEAPNAFVGDYKAGADWKRALHQQKGTAFFETTSADFEAGVALTKLAAELERRGVKLEFNVDRKVEGGRLLSNEQLASIIRTFQQHVKANSLSMLNLRSTGDTDEWKSDRTTRFLDLYERIANEWERQLRAAECIDFDDMLLAAIDHIETGRYQSPFTVILADEFQDSSRARVRLLKALHAKAPGQAHVCVVGDDWQGINRFAGADISAMTSFEQTFDHSTRLMLSTTFRCPKPICEASSQFVQANPRQIPKSVQTTSSYGKKALFAYVADSLRQATDMLAEQLQQMFDHASTGNLKPAKVGEAITVMLLGRYRRDQPAQLRRWQNRFGRSLEITFRTIHGSKGLEADYVILLNAVEDLPGFPSQVADDPILQLAMPAPDPLPYAEERRLFYVALTRAKRQVRIFTTKSAPSRFVLELANAGYLELESSNGLVRACPKCGNGLLKTLNGKFGAFQACSNAPLCNFKRNLTAEEASKVQQAKSEMMCQGKLSQLMSDGYPCPQCKTGTMTVRSGPHSTFLGCTNYPDCKTTADFRPTLQP